MPDVLTILENWEAMTKGAISDLWGACLSSSLENDKMGNHNSEDLQTIKTKIKRATDELPNNNKNKNQGIEEKQKQNPEETIPDDIIISIPTCLQLDYEALMKCSSFLTGDGIIEDVLTLMNEYNNNNNSLIDKTIGVFPSLHSIKEYRSSKYSHLFSYRLSVNHGGGEMSENPKDLVNINNENQSLTNKSSIDLAHEVREYRNNNGRTIPLNSINISSRPEVVYDIKHLNIKNPLTEINSSLSKRRPRIVVWVFQLTRIGLSDLIYEPGKSRGLITKQQSDKIINNNNINRIQDPSDNLDNLNLEQETQELINNFNYLDNLELELTEISRDMTPDKNDFSSLDILSNNLSSWLSEENGDEEVENQIKKESSNIIEIDKFNCNNVIINNELRTDKKVSAADVLFARRPRKSQELLMDITNTIYDLIISLRPRPTHGISPMSRISSKEFKCLDRNNLLGTRRVYGGALIVAPPGIREKRVYVDKKHCLRNEDNNRVAFIEDYSTHVENIVDYEEYISSWLSKSSTNDVTFIDYREHSLVDLLDFMMKSETPFMQQTLQYLPHTGSCMNFRSLVMIHMSDVFLADIQIPSNNNNNSDISCENNITPVCQTFKQRLAKPRLCYLCGVFHVDLVIFHDPVFLCNPTYSCISCYRRFRSNTEGKFISPVSDYYGIESGESHITMESNESNDCSPIVDRDVVPKSLTKFRPLVYRYLEY